MMSQNRASDYDRLQARNDYHVNTQSKEEIRLLHEKVDHLVQQDQSDLLTSQKLQTEMLMAVSQQVEKISDDIRILKVVRLERGTHEDKTAFCQRFDLHFAHGILRKLLFLPTVKRAQSTFKPKSGIPKYFSAIFHRRISKNF